VPLPVFKALSPGRYRVQFTAGPELRDDLYRLKALMRSEIPDGDLSAIVGKGSGSGGAGWKLDDSPRRSLPANGRHGDSLFAIRRG
jgi:hypothetical protein